MSRCRCLSWDGEQEPYWPTGRPCYHPTVAGKKRLPHFVELDGVRGLAALAVFMHHFFNEYTDRHAFIAEFAEPGHLGVQVFFVLSGFLITSLLFVERGERSMLRNFYWKRVLRIWPALLVYLCAAYTLTVAGTRYVVLSLLFVSNLSSVFRVYEMGPTWTLAIEEQFYLIWPQVVRVCKVNTVFWLSLWIYVLSVTLRTLVPIFRHDAIALPYTPYQCDGLALGAVLACQWFAKEELTRPALKVSEFLNSGAALMLWLLLLAIEVRLYRAPMRANLNISIQMTLVTFFAYRLLVLIVLKRSSWTRWLGYRPWVFCGSVSYGFYLYHGIVLERIERVLGPVNASNCVARLAFGLGSSLAISYLSLQLIELPVRRLRKYVVDPRPAQASVAS